MADERWHRTQELFLDALEIAEDERQAFLADACGKNLELRQAVERLLAGHLHAPSFIDRLNARIPLELGGDLVGQSVGPYRLEHLLGEGGMGVVYRASQDQPIRRTVALKLIQLGMATREVIARFESERQALAVLDHPNIAKVFDAGATEQGHPYFVMEMVHGVAVTRYCDENRLNIRQRLKLIMQVCSAVHHAHQKGIIHCDLKPSNVLVAEHDGAPVPKVIDFGIARAINTKHRSETALTRHGGLIGTPEYMSPEQAKAAPDIDIRADVYSLGVLTHELLVGQLPIDYESPQASGTPKRIKRLFGSDTRLPSSRISTLGASAQVVAEQRRTHPSALRRMLSGDLDWIITRALEPERYRRYGAVSELADDLARHLRDEPVTAGPPEIGYRLGKFAKRHRFGVSVAVGAVILLVVFSIVTFWQATQLRRALDRSEHEARKAQEVTEFLTGLFQISNPSESRGSTIAAREILDRGAQRVASELGGQPEIQAAMMGTIGGIYVRLGLLAEAETLITSSLELQQRTLDPLHSDIAATHFRLSELFQWQDDLAGAEAQARRALELVRTDSRQGQADEARYLTRLGSVLHNAGKYAQAEAVLRRALEVLEPIGPADVEPIIAMGELSLTLRHLGKFAEAEELLRQVIDRSVRTQGTDHPETATHMLNLASIVSELDRNAEAEVLLREALEVRRRVYGEEHIAVAVAMNNLARICQRLGKGEEAESLHREVIDMRRRLQGSEHSDVAVALSNLGVALRLNGQYEEAEALYREALALNQRILGTDHPTVAIGHHNLSVLLRRQGQLTQAETEVRRAIEILSSALGERHPHVARSWAALGKVLILDDRLTEAEKVLRDALAIQVETLPAGHRRTTQTQLFLGECLAGTRQFVEAESLLRAALAGHTATRGADNENTLEAASALVDLYEAWGRPQDAERYRGLLASAASPST